MGLSLATSPLTAKPVSLWPTCSGQVACRDGMHRAWAVSALTLPPHHLPAALQRGQVHVLTADTVGCFQVSCYCSVGLRSLFLHGAPERPLRRPGLVRQAGPGHLLAQLLPSRPHCLITGPVLSSFG